MSRSTPFRALVSAAVIAAFGASAAGARAGETTLRVAGADRTVASAKQQRAAHPVRVGLRAPAPTARRAALRMTHILDSANPLSLQSAASSPILPNDPDWSQEWGLRQVEAPAAWTLLNGASRRIEEPAARTLLGSPSRPVVVAVVDSGVDPNQPDLQGALVPGADFVDSTGSTADQYGHGTMVAGVIAARGNNGQGVAGVCWACLIMPVKVLDANGTGTATGIAEGIRWAADHGANVINMSFILTGPDADVEAAIAYAHAQGVIVVAAAGNTGTSEATYPAAYPFVVSVAATDDADRLYPWSTYGSWVTLAAPGCTMTTVLGGGFAQFCGTSAATPVVAGLAALGYEAGATSEAQLEAMLERTAKPLPGAVGSGRVDALQLVTQFVS